MRRAVAGYFGLCTFLDEQVGKVIAALNDAGLSENTRVVYTSDHGDNLGARGVWGKSTMYEEAAAVPLIAAGEGIPAGRVVDAATSHVDVYPFIFETVGESDALRLENDMPGISLTKLATGAQPDRIVISEYHGMGSSGAVFMVRLREFKYVYYLNFSDQLFDLKDDPQELNDLAGQEEFAGIVKEARARLYAVLDPVDIDRRAKARQSELLQRHGGRDAVIARGDLGFSVPPGVTPMFD